MSRGRPRSRSVTRSPTPQSYHSRSPSVHRRSPSPGDRSPSPRRNGRRDSRSPSRTPSRSRSYSRDRYSRPRSSRSESPLPRSTKIVVERLTKNVNEDHLYEIFGDYGQIRDLDLPMNRTFGTNRGTAYILYDNEADAEAAIAHMHEAQLDGAVINVSIVLPRRKLSPPPPEARRGANFDPRGPPPGAHPSGPGGPPFRGRGGRGRRASPPPAGGRSRYPPGSDTYRPRSVSRSRSRSPVAPGSGSRRYRSRSPSNRSRSRSRTPPTRGRGGRGGGRRPGPDRDDRRKSPSRGSYDSYDRRSRSRSREWSRR